MRAFLMPPILNDKKIYCIKILTSVIHLITAHIP